jgi:predicted PurR-regulated permease PerM
MNTTDTTIFAKRVLTATLIVLGVLLLLYLAFLARGPLIWLGIAAFFAVAINPTVKRVARFMPKKNMALAALVVLLLVTVVGIGIAILFLAPLVEQTAKLIGSIPSLVSQISKGLANTPVSHSLHITKNSINSFVETNIDSILNSASFVGTFLLDIVLGVVDSLIAVVAIISLIFFMTVESKRWKQVTISLFRPDHRKQAARIGAQVYGIINGYVVGNIILSLIFGVTSALVLWIMKSPYFLPLGLAVGLIDLIPLVGSSIGAALVAIICVLTGQYWTAAVFIIYTILYVQLENNVLNPAIYSKNVDVSPLIVLASILIGGATAGIIGALIAIPVAATIQVVARELLKGRLNAKS